MLRGINRYIIEINDPENIYFDKVILFVKPQFSNEDTTKLNKEGRRIIDTAYFFDSHNKKEIKRNNKWLLYFFVFFSAIFILAGIFLFAKN